MMPQTVTEATSAPVSRAVKQVFAAAVVATTVAVFSYAAVRELILEPQVELRALDILPQSFSAPNFALPDGKGTVRSLADYRGKVVMLNFWASWCPPCRDEMPQMARLAADLAPRREFAMLAVSVDDGWEPVKSYLAQAFGARAPQFTILLDEGGKISEAYGTSKYPETYIIDRQGRVVAKFVGPRDWEKPAAKRYLEKLLD
jgi:cytochrome c biogenesis protein CcmG, thiol:disulfide interchange protein DsbE